jgi:hypothetical protein
MPVDLTLPIALLAGIIAVHAAYFLAMRGRTSRHEITLVDYSGGALADFRARAAGEEAPRALIIGEDLVIDEHRRFTSPLKIRGDLIIEGFATFEAPVIIDGHVHVRGEATFEQGLLSRQDVLVSGRLTIGSLEGGGWLVARRLGGVGLLTINGAAARPAGSVAQAA